MDNVNFDVQNIRNGETPAPDLYKAGVYVPPSSAAHALAPHILTQAILL